ncbi:MAG: FtsX-like permease family protein, partial [Gemmataceae bacterium]
MNPLHQLLSLRYLLQRWDRAALIVASIALGVATLVSARILNRCLGVAAEQTTSPAISAADLVLSNGELGIPRMMLDELRSKPDPAVQQLTPLIFERINLPDQRSRSAVLLGAELTGDLAATDNPLGIQLTQLNPSAFALLRTWVIVSRNLLVEFEATRKYPNDPFRVRFGSRTVDCVPVAVIDFAPNSPLGSLGVSLVGMELNQAIRLTRTAPPAGTSALLGSVTEPMWDVSHPPRINRIDLKLNKIGLADRAAVQERLQQRLGHRAKVDTPDSHGAATQEIITGMQVGFLLCSAGAMVVGLFLVYNALSVTVAERRHDIGILRSIGATRWQVVRLFLLAALVLGLIGAIVGVPLGLALARYTLSHFREELGSIFLNPDADPGELTLSTIFIATFAGLATALLAALIPSVQAASDQPADAVRRTTGGARGYWRVLHLGTCAALIGGGFGMILLRHSLPNRIGAFGGMMTALIGLLLAAPILVTLLVRMLQPILRRVLPLEARLAADNLTRAPGRTGLVIGALGAGVAVMIQTAGVGLSNERPIVQWIDEVIQADEFIFAGSMAEGTSSQSPMEPKVIRELAAQPGVEHFCGLRYLRPEYNDTIIFLIAMDARAFADGTQSRAPVPLPDLDALRKLDGTSNVVVSDNFARRHNKGVGDSITLPGPRGPLTFRIENVIRDYSWSRGTVFLDRSVYTRLYGDELVDVGHAFLKPGAAPEPFHAAVSERGLVRFDRLTVRQFFAELIERVYKLAYLQQIIVGIVAALGVVTALLISVLQRKRELGLLLAVGATPNQVLRSVLAEAALMGAFGTLMGFLIGFPLEWYVVKIILLEESGFAFDVIFPWKAG